MRVAPAAWGVQGSEINQCIHYMRGEQSQEEFVYAAPVNCNCDLEPRLRAARRGGWWLRSRSRCPGERRSAAAALPPPVAVVARARKKAPLASPLGGGQAGVAGHKDRRSGGRADERLWCLCFPGRRAEAPRVTEPKAMTAQWCDLA